MATVVLAEARVARAQYGVVTRSPYWEYTELDPIRVQIQISQVSASELEQHLTEQSALIRRSAARGGKSYMIIEARDATRPPPDVRKLQAEWIEENREYIARTCLGMSFVIPHRIVRGALTAIFWVTRSPVPYKVHSSLDEALGYAVGVCDENEVSLPLEARRPDAAARVESAFARVAMHRAAL